MKLSTESLLKLPTAKKVLILGVVFFFLDVFVRRVVVNYAKVTLALLGAALRIVTRRKAAVAPEDARLATLLERKARLREAVTARYGQAAGSGEGLPRTDLRGGGEEGPGKAGELRVPAGAGAEETRRAAAVRGAEGGEDREGGKPGEPPPALGESFTARLLEAKRRALKRDEKKT